MWHWTRRCWEQFCVLRLSLVYRGRAIPLVWRELPAAVSRSTPTVAAERRTLLPAGVEVVSLGIAALAIRERIGEAATGWHYHLRLKGTCWFCWRGQWRQLKQIHLAGQAVPPFRHAYSSAPNCGCPSGDCPDPVSGNFWRSSVLAPQLCKLGTMACASILRIG